MTAKLFAKFFLHLAIKAHVALKVKLCVLRPVQQPRSYWDIPSALSLVRVEPAQRCILWLDAKRAPRLVNEDLSRSPQYMHKRNSRSASMHNQVSEVYKLKRRDIAID